MGANPEVALVAEYIQRYYSNNQEMWARCKFLSGEICCVHNLQEFSIDKLSQHIWTHVFFLPNTVLELQRCLSCKLKHKWQFEYMLFYYYCLVILSYTSKNQCVLSKKTQSISS